MRVMIPERIKKLAELIKPYMEFDPQKKGFFLKEDAPNEIIAAQKEYHEWMSENCAQA